MMSHSPVLVDDKESRFWTIERQSSILTPTSAKSRSRKLRPLSFLRPAAAASAAQEENLVRDAERVHSDATNDEAPLPFSAPVPKRLPKSDSASLLSRQFKFYYWSPHVPECYATDMFLMQNAIVAPERRDADAQPAAAAEALRIVRAARKLIVVASPKETTQLIVTPETPLELLAALVLDKDGRLKAPCLRVGGTIVVGYSPSVFKTSLFFGNASPPPSKKKTAKRIARATAAAAKLKQAENAGNAAEQPRKRHRAQRPPLSPTPPEWTPVAH